jgi:phage baseplate assembly protein W
MSSLSVTLPLKTSLIDGYMMNKSLKSLIKQNLKMLILTNPGERVMEPTFGAGLNRYLFQNFTESTYSEIDTKIRQQVIKYMPSVKINRISFDPEGQDFNKLSVSIEYSVPKIHARDLLEFTI